MKDAQTHNRANLLSRALRRVHGTLLGHQAQGRRNPGARRTSDGRRPAVDVPPEPASQAPLPPCRPPSEAEQRQAELEQDLQLARDIQQGLLLEAVPRLPGWELSAVSLPARTLGGDLYDFLPLAGGLQGIMIGDVSGKGLPAALRMAVARTVFRHEARRGAAPGLTLAAVNRSVLIEIPQGMVTMLYALLDPISGTLQIANAGHTFPLLVNGSVIELELTGLPLGVDVDSDYDELTATLAPGNSVLLYTDGVIEATNVDDEIFGFERLRDLLEGNATLKPRALMALLLHELRTWSGGNLKSDDVTMVVLRRRFSELGAELRSIAGDVLGGECAAELWDEIMRQHTELRDGAAIDLWIELLPQVGRIVQGRFGRGVARELQQQLRLAIEDYRS